MDDLKSKINNERFLFLNSDILVKGSLESCIEKAHKKFGKIDCAIHAAYPKSKGWGSKFEDLKEHYLMEDIQNQLGLAIIFSQKIIKYFLRQGNGNLIHFSSIQGISAPKFEHYAGTSMCSPIEYSAIKSGIISITKYLSKYYKNKNLRINCISPGGVYANQPEKFLVNYNKSCNSKGILNAKILTEQYYFFYQKFSLYKWSEYSY